MEKILPMLKTLIERAKNISPAEADLKERTQEFYAALDTLNGILEEAGIKGGCDILNRDDYIASKLWSNEDVEAMLQQEGYAGTEDEVGEVINTGCLDSLNDCTDYDWDIISCAIFEAARCGHIAKTGD